MATLGRGLTTRADAVEQAVPHVCSVRVSRRSSRPAERGVVWRLQQASVSLGAALLVGLPAQALELPELPNPFAKSETEQTREAVSEQTASLPTLTESNNPTDFNQQQVPGLKARSTKSSESLAGVTVGKDSQGVDDVEERKPGQKGGELLSEGGAEFNPSGNR